jgi:ribosomal protein L17
MKHMAESKKAKNTDNPSNGDAKHQAADAAVEQIRSMFGEGSIMKFGDVKATDIDAVPTGCVSLDLALGIGGMPRGRVIEIFGPEASGKTTLAQHVIAEAQRAGGVAAFVDAEHALDPDYARKFGRTRNQRSALLKALAISLIKRERIETTEAKAKELRPYVEKMVTQAKANTAVTRRLLSSKLQNNTREVTKLVEVLAPKYAERKGGYTRVLKLPIRKADGAPMALIEFV